MNDSDVSTLIDNHSSQIGATLDKIGVGTFKFDGSGHLCECNSTAAEIFGLDSEAGWEYRHISRLDCVMGTGLVTRFENDWQAADPFCRTGLQCINSRGRYMILNICGFSRQTPESGVTEMVGLVEDIGQRPGGSAEADRLPLKLKVLTDVAEALSSSLDLGQILKMILTGATASQGLGFNRAFLFLYDEAKDSLIGHLAVGPSTPEEAGHIWRSLDSMRLTLGELLDADDELRENDPITHLIKDLTLELRVASAVSEACNSQTWVNLDAGDEIDEDTAEFLDRLGTRSVALVPMVSKGNLMGLLVADNKITSTSIVDSDVEMLQTLANNAAVAMERARLYDSQFARTRELQRVNQLLADSQEQIIKIEKMSVIGQLTSAIAHELRNPLTVIGGFANLMLQSNVQDDQREYLDIIASETKRTEGALHELLDFYRASKRDSGKLDFVELVGQSLQLLVGRLSQVNIVLKAHMDQLCVYGNYDQLSHAVFQFLQLVGQEIIPPGSAEVHLESRQDCALMTIQINVPEENRQNATRALKQLFSDNRSTQRLTLLVAGETIRYHGGNSGLASADNSCPSLFIELPLVEE